MEKKHSKITIIGAGMVGATVAFSLATQRIVSEIAIIDVNVDKAEGEAMDISHGMVTMGNMDIHCGSYEHDIPDSNLIIVTAGLGRKPGETRIDLAHKNVTIARDITKNIMKYYKDAVIMVVANPVDVLTYVIQKESGLPAGRVFGTGAVLDSARFRYLLSTRINADIRNIHGFIAGEHGETQFPVWSSVHVSGMKLDSFCEKLGVKLDKVQLVDDLVASGAQVISKKGVTNYAIAAVVAELANTVIKDKQSIFSVTSILQGYYGIDDVAISVPSFVGAMGVSQPLLYDFTAEEKKNLTRSANQIKAVIDSLGL